MRRVEFISNTAEAPVVPEPTLAEDMPKEKWDDDEAIAAWSRRMAQNQNVLNMSWDRS